MLESVKEIDANYHSILSTLEWVVTVFFTIEYIARVVCIKKPTRYIFSFYGIIDFLSMIPLYLSYIFAGSQVLLAVRAFRLLRVFRILKLVQFLGEASQLNRALKASRAKIYWAIVTITTVGYGDIAPITPQGQLIATIIMLLGYGIIAVPTGIVTSEFGKQSRDPANKDNRGTYVHVNTQSCPTCSKEGHRDDARHCYNCGAVLNE